MGYWYTLTVVTPEKFCTSLTGTDQKVCNREAKPGQHATVTSLAKRRVDQFSEASDLTPAVVVTHFIYLIIAGNSPNNAHVQWLPVASLPFFVLLGSLSGISLRMARHLSEVAPFLLLPH